jgi:hypothetical protein
MLSGFTSGYSSQESFQISITKQQVIYSAIGSAMLGNYDSVRHIHWAE